MLGIQAPGLILFWARLLFMFFALTDVLHDTTEWKICRVP